MQVIDYRNGRYQGQLYNNLPHGVGIYFSIHLVFVIGHWNQGKLSGRTIIIYPNGTTFCGFIEKQKPCHFCYYELQRQNIKVYFSVTSDEKSKLAVLAPSFGSVLQLNNPTFEIIANHPYKVSHKNPYQSVSSIAKTSLTDNYQQQNEGFISYFQIYFSHQYPDIFELLRVNLSGRQPQCWLGFKGQGLGIKVKPLSLTQQNGKTYKISEIGVMTKQNMLVGIGMRTLRALINKIEIEEGVFSLPQTLTIYQIDEGKNINTRPPKCKLIFINYLKRSMDFTDSYLILSQIDKIKEEINRISEATFNQMKIQNAHKTIEQPLSNSQVLFQIEKARKRKAQQTKLYKRGQFQSNLQPNIFNSGLINPLSSSFNLTSLKEQLNRSVSKKKASKSRIADIDSTLYTSPHKKSTQKRLNGSITPKKNGSSQQNKKVGVIVNQNSPKKNSPKKYKAQKQIIQQPKIKKTPSSILKPSPEKIRSIYKPKIIDSQDKGKLDFQRKTSPPKKYGDIHRRKAPSPIKNHHRPIFTQNMFE